MPIARFAMPDGRVARFEVPEGLSPEEAQDLVSSSIAKQEQKSAPAVAPTEAAPVEKPKERTFGEAATDLAAGLTSGIGSVIQLPGQLYGLATGDFEDSGILGFGKRIAKSGEDMKSEALKQKEKQRSQKIQDAEDKGQWEAFKTAFGETVKDPALFASFLAEQAPQMLVPFGGAKVIKGLTLAKGLRAGLPAIEATQAAGAAGTRAAIGAGAVQQGSDIGAGAYEELYKALVLKGTPEEEAKSQALNLARAAGASGAVISLLAQRLPGAKTLEESFAGVPGTSGRLLGAAKGALGETASEIVEETGGKFAQNVAMRQVNPEQQLAQGLGATAGMAAIGGGMLGGVAGALRTPQADQAAQPPPPPPEAPQIDPDKYGAVIKGLTAAIPDSGLTDSSKLGEIFKASGIENEAEVSAYLNQAITSGEIVANSNPVFNVTDANGKVLFNTVEKAVADKAAERLNAEDAGTATVAEATATKFTKPTGMPQGIEVRAGQFKQDMFNISRGDTILNPEPLSAEEVGQKAYRLSKITAGSTEANTKEIEVLQKKIDTNNTSKEKLEAAGEALSPEYATLSAQVNENNALIQAQIDEVKQKGSAFSGDISITPAKESDEGFTLFKQGKPAEYFKTEEDLNQALAAEPTAGTTSPKPEALDAAREALREKLLPFLKQVGLENTGLRIMDSIENGQGESDGRYTKQLIDISLKAANPMGTLRHETIHALKELGAFSKQEWNLLESYAKKQWINQFLRQRKIGDSNYYDTYKKIYLEDNPSIAGFDEYIIEEAIADAFKYFNATKPPANIIGNIYRKVKALLEGLGNQLSGLGFQTADDVFKRVESGGMKPTQQAGTGAAPRYSLEPRITGNGEIVGSPPGARKVADRERLVTRMTNFLSHPYSLYDDSKNWYERSGATIREITRSNPELTERVVRLMALYSQANSLGGNTTATIKSIAQLAAGEPTAFAGRFPDTTAARIPALLAAPTMDASLPGVDDKLMNFYRNLHDATYRSDTFKDASTIDRWMMRLFGYPHSEDQDVGGAEGVSGTQYIYAKDLISRISQANKNVTGEDLKPRQIQAVLWTYVRNTTDYNSLPPEKQIDFKPSIVDFSDYITRATANITWESRPSTKLPLIPGIHTAPRTQQADFNRAVREIFIDPNTGEDKIFKLLGNQQLYSSQLSMGAYENLITPNVITKLVLQKDDGNYLTDVANKYAAIIGYVTKNDAVPWYRADSTAGGKDASKGYRVTATNIAADPAFEERLFKHLNEKIPGVGFTRVGDSFDFINFRDADTGKPSMMSDKQYFDKLQKALESFDEKVDFDVEPFRAKSGWISNDWAKDINGQGYLKRFSSKELANLRRDIEGWSKAYNRLAEEYGKEYGWAKITPKRKATKDDKFSLQDTVYIDGVNRPTTDSRGRPIFNTLEGIKNFWRGFGDSAIVDKDGKPMLMYHGTTPPEESEGIFSQFRSSDDGKMGKGIYTTSIEKYAESFAPSVAVMPIYISMSNPFYINLSSKVIEGKSARTLLREQISGESKDTFDKNYFRLDSAGSKEINNALNNEIQSITDGKRIMDMSGISIQRALKKAGYDGIVVKDSEGNFVEVNAFDSEQIKSATGNRGTFSPKSKDIRYSLREKADELKAMSESKRDALEMGDFDYDAYTLYEAEKLMPPKDGAFKKLNGNNSFVVHNEADAVVNVDGNPFLATEVEDPDNEDETIWHFSDPKESSLAKGITTDFSDKVDAVSQLKQKLKESEGKPVKYSLRDDFITKFGQADLTNLNSKTHVREEVGYAKRLVAAFSPDSRVKLRAQIINRLEAIERQTMKVSVDPRYGGSNELLADVSATAAALQSQRASGIAAESFKRGVPVYAKGFTSVSDLNGTVKGLIPIFQPLLNKYKDPMIWQIFQFYSATRRGERFAGEGREKLFTKADFQKGRDYGIAYPEFDAVFKDYQKYNEALVKFQVDTGVLTPEMGRKWMIYSDYIPFYRQINGEETLGPKLFQNFSGVKPTPIAKGSDVKIADFLETIILNSRSAIENGMKNVASQRIARDAMRTNSPGMTDMARKLLPYEKDAADVIHVRENGVDVRYKVADILLVEAMKGLGTTEMGSMLKFLSYPTKVLRDLVTKDPGFMLANLFRDSAQAYVTSGVNMIPIIDTFKQAAKILANQSPEAKALMAAGIGGGYEFSGDVKASAKAVSAALNEKAGIKTGWQKALWPVSKVWSALEAGTTASDLATRSEIYARVMKSTNGNEAEAVYQALEVMNFGRMGSSPVIQVVSALVPFFNARVQGLDVLYRAGTGRLASASAKTQQKLFARRAMYIMGMSIAYWMLARDTDEWKRASKETRDNNWIIGSVKVPIPFEIGTIFKVLPERILEYTFGNDTGADLADSAFRNIASTLKMVPVPQAVLPLVEAYWLDYSFFTGNGVVGRGMEKLDPQFQLREGTSLVAKKMGDITGMSPVKIDHVLQGYTGAMGMYAASAISAMIRTEDDGAKASMSLEQTPILKRFFASDKAGGSIDAFYEFKKQVDMVVATQDELQKRGNPEQYIEYMKTNGKLLGAKQIVSNIGDKLSEMRKLRNIVNFSKSMPPDQKRETLDNIRMAEIKLTESIKGIRAMVTQ